MKMLVWIGYAVGGLLAFVAVAVAVGYALPRDHVAAGEATIAAPPERIAALIRAVEQQPAWREGVTAIEIHGRDGTAVDYTEVSGGDRIRFKLRETAPASQFESVITDDTLPFGGRWTIELTPVGDATRVAIEERGTVRHPLYRLISALVIGHHATLRRYLSDLSQAARPPSTPAA